MDLGKKIKNLRVALGLTQKYVADKLQIAQQNISDWENDKTRPEYENLIKLALLYDTSTDYLLGLEDEIGKQIKDSTYIKGNNNINFHGNNNNFLL
jgi:transcriptional regulator with XRE-family HTH domain